MDRKRHALFAIEAQNDEFMGVPIDALGPDEARRAAEGDLEMFALIGDDVERCFACLAMADNARTQAAYRAELRQRAPGILPVIESLLAGSEAAHAFADVLGRALAAYHGMPPDEAREWARMDLEGLLRMRDPVVLALIGAVIASNMTNQYYGSETGGFGAGMARISTAPKELRR